MKHEFKGTKGEWILNPCDSPRLRVSNTDLSEDICECLHEEDALLIAQAPLLLKAIQMNIDKVELSQVDFFEKYSINISEVYDHNKQLVNKVTSV